jgi:hypothetical protein
MIHYVGARLRLRYGWIRAADAELQLGLAVLDGGDPADRRNRLARAALLAAQALAVAHPGHGRRELVAEFATSPTGLSLYLSGMYAHMYNDEIPTDVAYRRTLSWIRSPLGTTPAVGTFTLNS